MGKHLQENNIKTINGETLVGSGNIEIEGRGPKPIIISYDLGTVNSWQTFVDRVAIKNRLEDIQEGDYFITEYQLADLDGQLVEGLCTYRGKYPNTENLLALSLTMILRASKNPNLILAGKTVTVAKVVLSINTDTGLVEGFREFQTEPTEKKG